MIAVLLGVGVAGAADRKPKARSEIAQLRQSLEGLKWKDIDYDSLSGLERCRALMLLNHAMAEVGAVAIAEADLMSEFVDKQNLGEEAASSPRVDAGLARNYEDARKIAVALLRGPMSGSSYATALANTDESGLKAYERLYDKPCRRKWSEFAECRQYVGSTAAFLKAKGKIKDYMAWADAESDRRQQEYEKEMAGRRTAAKAGAEQKKAEGEARMAELEQQRQQQAESSRQAQQLLYGAQADASGAVVVDDDDDDDDWLPGYGIVRRARPRAWHRDRVYHTQARKRTNQRIDAGRRSGRGGGRRR
jgi:hypothetical protein